MKKIAAIVFSLVLAVGTMSFAQQQGGPQGGRQCQKQDCPKNCPKDCKGPGQGGKQCPRSGENCPRK